MSLYELVVRQLHDDGHVAEAAAVAARTGVRLRPDLPRNRLTALVGSGGGGGAGSAPEPAAKRARSRSASRDDPQGLEAAGGGVGRPFPSYRSRKVAQHRAACRVGAFAADGRLAASGAADSAIKLLDVARAARRSDGGGGSDGGGAPVLRTYYPSDACINDLAFHPHAGTQLLASASTCDEDGGPHRGAIRFWEVSKASKQSARNVMESSAVRSLAWHPSGDFLLVGTDHHMPRVLDLASGRSYVSPDTAADKLHQGPVNMVRWAEDGRRYATCSDDGAVKLWDGVTNACVLTVAGAHQATAVSSVALSRDGSKILSGGFDGVVRLWDAGSGRQIAALAGCEQLTARVRTVFSPDEGHALSTDEMGQLAVWNLRSPGPPVRLRDSDSHAPAPVCCVAWGPSGDLFMTCCDDYWVRFWQL